MPRSFLFLQGLASRFFDRFGRALAARGHAVHRVNFNGGDRLFWRLPGATDYRGRLRDWPDFLDRLLVGKGITDVILFGDCRPVHRAAIPVLRARAIRVHVVEEGYIRPHWITFEEGGVNANSALPRDPDWYRDEANRLPCWSDVAAFPETFTRRAAEDVAYTLARLASASLYPHYRTHRLRHPLAEYAGWVGRLAVRGRAERRARAAIAALEHCANPIFLFPLQLDGDAQIKVHAPAWSMRPTIERVVASFARHAPPQARLLAKLHPFDDGLVNWARIIRQSATAHGIAHRLIVIDGGDAEALLRFVRAVVTVNSTVGVLALARGVPVIALGQAIYDMPGLTFQGELDAFWHAPAAPDMRFYDAFRRVLAARCLIPGGFFSDGGIALAVDAAVARVEAGDPLSPRRKGVAETPAFVETDILTALSSTR